MAVLATDSSRALRRDSPHCATALGANAGKVPAQFGGAVQVACGIKHNAGEGKLPVGSLEDVQVAFDPTSMRRDKLEHGAKCINATCEGRTVQVSGAVENEAGLRLAMARKIVEHLVLPTLRHLVGRATVVRSAYLRRAIEIARPIHNQGADWQFSIVANVAKVVQYRFCPGAALRWTQLIENTAI